MKTRSSILCRRGSAFRGRAQKYRYTFRLSSLRERPARPSKIYVGIRRNQPSHAPEFDNAPQAKRLLLASTTAQLRNHVGNECLRNPDRHRSWRSPRILGRRLGPVQLSRHNTRSAMGFWTSLKFSRGLGQANLARFRRALVEGRRWLGKRLFPHVLASFRLFEDTSELRFVVRPRVIEQLSRPVKPRHPSDLRSALFNQVHFRSRCDHGTACASANRGR